jgi:L-amino acid N-acyltransferase YncA
MALHELALYALEQGLKQLYAVVSEENIRGCKLFLRAGYEKISILPRWLQSEGRFVDAILFIKQLTD